MKMAGFSSVSLDCVPPGGLTMRGPLTSGQDWHGCPNTGLVEWLRTRATGLAPCPTDEGCGHADSAQ